MGRRKGNARNDPAPSAHAGPSVADLEKQFNAAVSPAEMGGWMQTMASEPMHQGIIGRLQSPANSKLGRRRSNLPVGFKDGSSSGPTD